MSEVARRCQANYWIWYLSMGWFFHTACLLSVEYCGDALFEGNSSHITLLNALCFSKVGTCLLWQVYFYQYFSQGWVTNRCTGHVNYSKLSSHAWQTRVQIMEQYKGRERGRKARRRSEKQNGTKSSIFDHFISVNWFAVILSLMLRNRNSEKSNAMDLLNIDCYCYWCNQYY